MLEMKVVRLVARFALAMVVTAGCDDTESSAGLDAAMDSRTTDANGEDADSGTSDSGTSDSGTSDSGTSDSGTSDSGVPDLNAVDADSPLEAHGCTFATSDDRTGADTVTITDTSAWVLPHKACIIVGAGTTVIWAGNFDFHPLRGGVSPVPDVTSPIDVAGPGAGTTPVSVVLDTIGDYAYFCGIHVSAMAGVIYVR